jgi:hypothetical protein
MASAKYKFRVELNVTSYSSTGFFSKWDKEKELYRYDLFKGSDDEGYDNIGDDHPSVGDWEGNVDDIQFFEGQYKENIQLELDKKYEEGICENVDELGLYENISDALEDVKRHASTQFPDADLTNLKWLNPEIQSYK